MFGRRHHWHGEDNKNKSLIKNNNATETLSSLSMFGLKTNANSNGGCYGDGDNEEAKMSKTRDDKVQQKFVQDHLLLGIARSCHALGTSLG